MVMSVVRSAHKQKIIDLGISPRRTAIMPEQIQSVRLDPTTYAQVVLKPNPDVESTTLDGETVLLHLGTGRYYTLNRVGTAIWEFCTGGNTISAIHQALCN